MVAYTARRIVWLLPVMVGVATITFVLMYFVPGGPWDQEKKLPPKVVENLNQRYGLDDPIWTQYWNFLSDAFRGDLGVSYVYQDRGVTEIIRQGFAPTAVLASIAFAITLSIGIPLGMAAALQKNSVVDYVTTTFATILASIPGFVLAIVVGCQRNWTLLRPRKPRRLGVVEAPSEG